MARPRQGTKPKGETPPELRPTVWQPGQSGNAVGRTRTEAQIIALARSHVPDAIAQLAAIMSDKRAASAARVRAAEVLIERGYGRTPVKVQLETDLAALANPKLMEAIRDTLLDAVAEAQAIEGQTEE